MRAYLALLAVAGCQVAPPVRVESEPYEVLREVRAAVGADVFFEAREGVTLSGVRTRGASGGGSLEQPFVLSVTPAGDFLVSTGIGEDSTTHGFDGSDAWTLDGRGVVRSIDLGAREAMLLDGWLRTQAWLVPGTLGLEVDLAREASDAASVALDVGRPGAHLSARVVVDRATMLPREYTIERSGAARRVTFADWRDEDGLRVPQRMNEWRGGALVSIDRVERLTYGTPPSFATPLAAPTDATFDGVSRPLATRLDDGGRYYVRGTVDGGHAAWFLLDTGFGAHGLSTAAAERFGLSEGADVRLSGVGGEGTGAWREAMSLRLGPLQLDAPRFATIDTAALSARAGFDVDGVLGAPLFQRAIVVLDGRSNSVTIFEPGRLSADGLAWSRVALDGTSPCVSGRLRPSTIATPELWFRLDTGSDDTVTVARWAVDRFDLDADRTRLKPSTLVGLFGEVQGWRTKLASLEFCGVERRGVEVTLLRESGPGPLSDPWLAGNLGMRALAGLRVVIDLGRRRVAVE